MLRKIRERLNIELVKNPGKIILLCILLLNVAIIMVSAMIISGLSLKGTENMGFWEAVFCTITMILDAGCVQFVIADIGKSGVAIAVICLVIIMVGMVTFTGAVIGYLTNYISDLIQMANTQTRLMVSEHVVILNWNTRGSEIINDLLYCNKRQTVVVLVNEDKKDVETEIRERLADTVRREKIHNKLNVIVREGDVFSSKQLNDISIKTASSVIILDNPQTIKTLMQVADLVNDRESLDNQKIIVEITDDWTWDLVKRIIARKQVEGKCNIVPVRVNRILGQILSQFSLMPELNMVYRELFSNKGAAFFSEELRVEDEQKYIREYLQTHKNALPLTGMVSGGKDYFYYVADDEEAIHKQGSLSPSDYKVDWNADYWMEQKNIIILGHNSNIREIMMGFEAFRCEWGYKDGHDEIVRILVIDEEENLIKMNYYKEYPFVVGTVAADICDREKICDAIEKFVDSHEEDTSVLILSDDSVESSEVDSHALAHLIYVQDIIKKREDADPDFNVESIDVIVEIIDPKHHDIVSSYSVYNVVISNRYISKMITQIGEKEALFDFYKDILTYDTDTSDGYESKEVYTKKVTRMFNSLPEETSAEELIRAIYLASTDEALEKEKRNPTLAIGYVKPGGRMIIFGDKQAATRVKLEKDDKMIVYSTH